MNYQAVFERQEKKYLLTKKQYELVRHLLDEHMEMDAFGLHTVNSLYLDTDAYDIIRASIAKPKYKEKIRLRSYGTPDAQDTVYLELKKKVDGVVYKRRMSLSAQNAERYLKAGIRPSETGQIFSEIDWAMQRLRPKPKVIISVERAAFYGKEDSDFRVTFDFNMRWRDDHLSLSSGSYGHALIRPDLCLMEVKTTHSLPLWLTRFLSQHEIFPTSFSKYGTYYTDHLLMKKGALSHVG